MEQSSNERFCKLCSKIIRDENLNQKEALTRKHLDVTLLNKLDFGEQGRQILCRVCFDELFAAMEFKSRCLNIDNIIVSYAESEEVLPIDLRDIYKSVNQIDILDDQQVCRLCMELVRTEFLLLNEVDIDIFLKYVPEMNFSVTKRPVICKLCVDSLATHTSFVKYCLDMDKNNKLDTFIKPEDIDIKFEAEEKEEEMSINIENIEINHLYAPSCDTCIKSEGIEFKSDGVDEEEDDTLINNASSELQCEEYDQESFPPSIILKGLNKDPSKVPWYKCDLCDYKSKGRGMLKRHMMIHKDPSEIQWYECDLCKCKMKHKSTFKQHMFKHKDPSEVQWYRCDLCDYKSMWVGTLNIHTMKHKKPSEIQWYKCDLCDHKAKRKGDLNRHMLKHKDPSEIHWHECDLCDYKAKRKGDLKKHMLQHKDPSKVQWYECYLCGHKSKQKNTLKLHITNHHSSQRG